MKKLFRTSVEQTGIAVYIDKNGNEIQRPMFSDNPCEEAREVARLTGDMLVRTFYSNNLLDYKIESLISEFVDKNGFLPENYMEELISGFPFILGLNQNYKYCYR